MCDIPDPGAAEINYAPGIPKTPAARLLTWKAAGERLACCVGNYVVTGDERWLRLAVNERFRLTDVFRKTGDLVSNIVGGIGLGTSFLQEVSKLAGEQRGANG